MNPPPVGVVENLEPRRFLAVALPPSVATDYTPDEIRHAYGFDQVSFGPAAVPADGRGQTIAVVVAYHSTALKQDLRAFDSKYGLPDRTPSGSPVLRIATPQSGTKANATWQLETATDVEWAHAIAPGAQILVVEARSQSPADLFKAVDYARRQRNVSVVSMSWGWDVAPAGINFQALFTTPRGHVVAGRRGGVTFVGAAADDGVASAWPDPSINIVSVGGTGLTLDNGAYGGESRLAQCLSPATVAFAATGFSVSQGGIWQSPGGTSAAAPQWAGLIAIANQGRASARKSSLNSATQTLPSLAALPDEDFHTITDATPATGRGSPFADRIIAGLLGVT
jgi:subtilase family serine protease